MTSKLLGLFAYQFGGVASLWEITSGAKKLLILIEDGQGRHYYPSGRYAERLASFQSKAEDIFNRASVEECNLLSAYTSHKLKDDTHKEATAYPRSPDGPLRRIDNFGSYVTYAGLGAHVSNRVYRDTVKKIYKRRSPNSVRRKSNPILDLSSPVVIAAFNKKDAPGGEYTPELSRLLAGQAVKAKSLALFLKQVYLMGGAAYREGLKFPFVIECFTGYDGEFSPEQNGAVFSIPMPRPFLWPKNSGGADTLVFIMLVDNLLKGGFKSNEEFGQVLVRHVGDAYYAGYCDAEETSQ